MQQGPAAKACCKGLPLAVKAGLLLVLQSCRCFSLTQGKLLEPLTLNTFLNVDTPILSSKQHTGGQHNIFWTCLMAPG